MFEDDLRVKDTEYTLPRDLEKLSVEELEEYVGELRNELVRTEIEIEKKRASRAAADSVFS